MSDVNPEWVEAGARALGDPNDLMDRDLAAAVIEAVEPLIRADERTRARIRAQEAIRELESILEDKS